MRGGRRAELLLEYETKGGFSRCVFQLVLCALLLIALLQPDDSVRYHAADGIPNSKCGRTLKLHSASHIYETRRLSAPFHCDQRVRSLLLQRTERYLAEVRRLERTGVPLWCRHPSSSFLANRPYISIRVLRCLKARRTTRNSKGLHLHTAAQNGIYIIAKLVVFLRSPFSLHDLTSCFLKMNFHSM